MRKTFERQTRFGRQSISDIVLNLNCRDEIVPILAALQHVYSRPQVREQILALVAGDVNQDSREDCGREGLDYWQILVLAAVRLGCNLDYDRLQDLAEQHRALRMMMGIGDWDDETNRIDALARGDWGESFGFGGIRLSHREHCRRRPPRYGRGR